MANARQARMIVVVVMAITGAAFFFEFLNDDLRNAGISRAALNAPLALRYILAMAAGGALAGALLAGFFGRTGVIGGLWAGLGALIAVVLTGGIGSALALIPDILADGITTQHLISAGFGLVLIPLSMIGRPVMILLWLGLAVCAHLLALRARQK